MGNNFERLVLSEAMPALAALGRPVAAQAAKNSGNKAAASGRASTTVSKSTTKTTSAPAKKVSTDGLKGKSSEPAKDRPKYVPTKPGTPKPAPKTSSGKPPPDHTPNKNDDDAGSNSTSDNSARSRFSNLAKKAREVNQKTAQDAVNKIRSATKDGITGTKPAAQNLLKGAIKQLGSSSVNN